MKTFKKEYAERLIHNSDKNNAEPVICFVCCGYGHYFIDIFDDVVTKIECAKCNGTGKLIKETSVTFKPFK